MHTHSKDFTNAKPVFNRKAIMTSAWAIVKSNANWRNLGLSFHMKRALLSAWHEAKMSALQTTQTPADKIRAAIDALENKSFHIDVSARRRELEAELANLTNPTDTPPTDPTPALRTPNGHRCEIINAVGG